jgi:hypothetical protein
MQHFDSRFMMPGELKLNNLLAYRMLHLTNCVPDYKNTAANISSKEVAVYKLSEVDCDVESVIRTHSIAYRQGIQNFFVSAL